MSESTALTQDEAIERARTISVRRYDIDVDLTGLADGPTIRTVSTISFEAIAGATTFVECAATVDRADLNGVPIAPDDITDGRIALSDLAPTNVLTVAAHQSRTSQLAGIQRSIDPLDGLPYVWMAFEPYDAHNVWACFDQPDLKAPHRFTVDAPVEWTVVSNTAPESVVERATDGSPTRRWSFPDTPALSTYVVVIDAGPFHEIRREHGDHSLGVYCRRSRSEVFERDADLIFDLTAAGLDFFGDRFGMPFPQHRYDQVFVPDMPGALENWGCVTWGDSLVADAPTHSDRSTFAEVLLHEMAHMWFGDLVTMRWWDDLWLNESFASWASVWALQQLDAEHADRWAQFVLERKLRAFAHDTSPATHPIQRPVADTSAAFASLDMITYAKGQTVLKQLVAFVGEAAFLHGLQEYFRRHAWGNATIDDLLVAISESADRDLGGWAEAWLRAEGTDTLNVRNGRLYASGADDGPGRPHLVEVTALNDTEDGLTPVGSVSVEVSTSDDGAVLDLPIGADTYLIDVGDHTFATMRGEPGATALLLDRIGQLPDTLARAQTVAMAWDMLRSGEVTPRRFVTSAAAAALAETRPAIVEPTLALATSASVVWAGDTDVDELVALTADAAQTIARTPANDQAHRLIALRTLAATASTEEQFGVVDAAADGADPTAVSIAWQILARRTLLGAGTDTDAQRLFARDTSAARRSRLLTVRAAHEDETAKGEVWDAVFVTRDAGSALEIANIARAFWARPHLTVVRSYAERFFDVAAEVDDTGIWFAVRTLDAMSPLPVVERWMLDRASTLADAPATHPYVRQWMTMFTDTAARVLRARQSE